MINKLKPYRLSIFILLVLMPLVFYLLAENLDFTYNKDKSITLLVSALGLVFAVFQVTLNIQIQEVRNKAALRHTEYKEIIKILNGVSELMNKEMTKDPNIEGLVSSLMNKMNEYGSFLRYNNTYLFKGIQDNEVMKETLYLIEELLVRTDKYRFQIDKIGKGKVTEVTDVEELFNHMEWHNDVIEILGSFNKIKHQALREVQKYIE